MSVDVLTFGLNHVSAPVSVRERVSFPIDVLRPAIDGLRSTFGPAVKEAAILSTCNRTEIYCAAEPQVSEHLPAWLADFNRLEAGSLKRAEEHTSELQSLIRISYAVFCLE